MDATIINPFLEATVSVFKSMFELEPAAGKPYIVTDFLDHRWDISGLVGLTGAAQGIISIRITRLLGDKLLEKSGVETKSEEERRDTVNQLIGELTNIICGNATSALHGINVDISPPVVVQGTNHSISWPKIAPVMGIPFTTVKGPFEVDVCFRKN